MTRSYIILLLFSISLAVFAVENRNPEERKPRVMRTLDLSARANLSRQTLPSEIADETLSREQQLIFGLAVLNRRHPIFNNDGYKYYLQELLSVTGYSADEAKTLIENYKNNPAQYLSVLEKIKRNLVNNYE